MDYAQTLALEFNIKPEYADNIIKMLDEGSTIPFIVRYRKELTGSIDDETCRNFSERLTYLRNLTKRKEEIIRSITEQDKMTEELQKAIDEAITMTEVEDIYRPYKPKRETRATKAMAKGLTPLAKTILEQKNVGELLDIALPFVKEDLEDPKKSVLSAEDALQGANDIIAEMVSDDAEVRKELREFIFKSAQILTTIKPGDNYKTYTMYDNYKEPVEKMPSHRILAINRGEAEDCLKVDLEVNEERCLEIIQELYLKKDGAYSEFIITAIKDSYDRLLLPSLEREIRNMMTENASEQAIKMFEVNLRPLLLQPPLKGKVILGLDPGYRYGCKLAVIDPNGNVLDTDVIYPTLYMGKDKSSDEEKNKAKIKEYQFKVAQLIKKHKINTIAIGNGTASKESEIFIADLIKKIPIELNYAMVNEAGASVYSASKLGSEEFPEFDVNLRSAVSIARRLQDPLAELIKIDVKSIGVGQYQHDMPQKRLTEVLDGVVESCVNSVGVDLNTASPSLLTFVSGLNGSIAKNICEYRKENGDFKDRKELLKVKKLGAKAYEQCAGFLRIVDGNNILDNTAVHPESYGAVRKLLELFNKSDDSIKNRELSDLPKLIAMKGEQKVADYCGIGVPTLMDMVTELIKPGRDIRDELPQPELRNDILDINDLKVGMKLKGVVRNVIDFGAFIDIGVHQDGLVHISQICDRYIKHPSEALTVGENVEVKIIGVDLDKNRIQLSMRNLND